MTIRGFVIMLGELYVARDQSTAMYTDRLEKARIFWTRQEAADTLVGRERIRAVTDEIKKEEQDALD